MSMIMRTTMILMTTVTPVKSLTILTCADWKMLDLGVMYDRLILHHVCKSPEAGTAYDADLGATLRLGQNPIRNFLDFVVRAKLPVQKDRFVITHYLPLQPRSFSELRHWTQGELAKWLEFTERLSEKGPLSSLVSTACNSLPFDIRSRNSTPSFRQALRTHLYKSYFVSN